MIHPGDNNRDHSRLGTLSNLYGRPLQLSAAISAARGDALLGPYLNEGKVGVIGYSAGGETALILSGAQPDWSVCTGIAWSAPAMPMPARPMGC